MANTPPLGWKNLKIGGVLHYNTPLRSLQPDGFSVQNPANFNFFPKPRWFLKGLAPFMTMKELSANNTSRYSKMLKIMGTNRYWCENSFGAIYHRLCWGWDIVKTKFCYQLLWLKNSHFSSYFSFFGHSNGCCNHSYAYFRNRLHPKTRRTYGMMVWNHFWPPRPYIHGWRG